MMHSYGNVQLCMEDCSVFIYSNLFHMSREMYGYASQLFLCYEKRHFQTTKINVAPEHDLSKRVIDIAVNGHISNNIVYNQKLF